jgi:hypothetical protein
MKKCERVWSATQVDYDPPEVYTQMDSLLTFFLGEMYKDSYIMRVYNSLVHGNSAKRYESRKLGDIVLK